MEISNTQSRIIFLILLILMLGIGYYLGVLRQQIAEKEAFETKINQLEQTFPPLNDVRALSGTISKISGNAITIENAQIGSPLEKTPPTRTVIITTQTKIVRQELKDIILVQKEGAEYQKAPAGKAPPSPFVEIPITLSDLKIGDQIIVQANENIKAAEQFTATAVIFPKPHPEQPIAQ